MKNPWMTGLLTTAVMWTATGCGGEPAAQRALDPAPAPPAEPAEEAGLTQRLTLQCEAGVCALDFRGAEGKLPRVMDVRLRSTAPVRFELAEPGAAATAAGKDVVVVEQRDGTWSVKVFSASNLNRIQSGRIATLKASRAGDAPAQVEIVTDQGPMLAPAEAMEGLTVSAPVSL